MKKTILMIILIISVIISSCKKEENASGSVKNEVKFTSTEKKFASNSNTFGLEFFKQIYSANGNDKNIMVSPLSVALALGMVYNGAEGETKTAIENTLYLNGMTTAQINEAYKGLIEKLISIDNTQVFNIANSIWYRNTFDVLDDFINTNQYYYNAEVKTLDFNNPESIIQINNWVAEKTNNKIDKIIEDIDPLTEMILLNAIYFKGTWKYEFDKKNTSLYPFHLEDNSVKDVNMMQQEGDFNIIINELFRGVELPYGSSGQFSMIVMIPGNYKNTDDIMAQLNDANWNNWLNSFSVVKDCKIGIPKFKFEFEKSLLDALASMGMGIAFTESADFSKINPNAQLMITEVRHKTYVDVDEQGTEAAAVTSVIVGTTSAGDNYIYADKPFLFVIKEKQTNAILFIGKVANPEHD